MDSEVIREYERVAKGLRGMGISHEAKRREVLQLLRDWRAFHTPFGGAMPTDESHLRSAEYTSGGYIESGDEFHPHDRRRLAESMDYLRHALTLLRIEDFDAWLSLRRPYLSDTADFALVSEWREKARRGSEDARGVIELHDRGVGRLAGYLANTSLYVVFPKRMSSMREKQIERRNDELWSLYKTFRYSDGMSRNKAIEKASEHCGYGRSRGYEIVDGREGRRAS
jgi:hypothetical protein